MAIIYRFFKALLPVTSIFQMLQITCYNCILHNTITCSIPWTFLHLFNNFILKNNNKKKILLFLFIPKSQDSFIPLPLSPHVRVAPHLSLLSRNVVNSSISQWITRCILLLLFLSGSRGVFYCFYTKTEFVLCSYQFQNLHPSLRLIKTWQNFLFNNGEPSSWRPPQFEQSWTKNSIK